MSAWQNHTLSNEWTPLATATPDPWQRVQVWFHPASVWASWNPVIRAFISDDGHVLHGVTHWRKGPAQTDGLLAAGDVTDESNGR